MYHYEFNNYLRKISGQHVKLTVSLRGNYQALRSGRGSMQLHILTTQRRNFSAVYRC